MAWGNSKSIVKRGPAPRAQRTSGSGAGSDGMGGPSCSPPPSERHLGEHSTPEPDSKPTSAPRTPEATPGGSARPSPPLSACPGSAPTGDTTKSPDLTDFSKSPTRSPTRRALPLSRGPTEPEGSEQAAAPAPAPAPVDDSDATTAGSEPEALALEPAPAAKKGRGEPAAPVRAPRAVGMTRRMEMREAALRKEEEETAALEASHLVGLIPKMEQLCANGIYKPWFYTRFFRAVPLPKKQRTSDLKMILQMEKEQGLEIITKPRPVREKRAHRRTLSEESNDDEGEEEEESTEEDTWIGCDKCQKWRRVPAGARIDTRGQFHCSMLAGVTCKTKEESWEEEEGWEEAGGKSKTAQAASRQERGKKRRAAQELQDEERRKGRKVKSDSHEPLSPQDVTTGSILYRSTSPKSCGGINMGLNSPLGLGTACGVLAGGFPCPPSMSRLEAVIRVLRSARKVMHYEALTKQALRMGLIRFSGSQGTAGESMKAFLNKIIRENRSNTIVNLGKGVYGLKEWVVEGGVVVDAGDSNEDSKSLPLPQHTGILNWNDFQHRYGGRGHSREQLHDMYLKTCGGEPVTLPPTPPNCASPPLNGTLPLGLAHARTHAEALQGGLGGMGGPRVFTHVSLGEVVSVAPIPVKHEARNSMGLANLLN